ncbi:hypothetical protein [Nocardia sp. CA-120079]|uniref:hypothetical protein n=1 Tax=Nocardia sp. CA-120079 TaxID=3239974 RepID=UPI003D976931
MLAPALVHIERRPKLPHELRRSMLDQDGADHRRIPPASLIVPVTALVGVGS